MNIIFKKCIVQDLIQIHIYTLIMLGHFKKSASLLNDQETQIVGDDQWPVTICNTDLNDLDYEYFKSNDGTWYCKTLFRKFYHSAIRK